MLNRASLILCCVCLLVAGCGERKPDSQSATTDTAVPSPRGPIAAPAAPANIVIPDTGDEIATLTQLSSELRRYVIRSRTAPTDFEDFLAKAGVKAPPAPAGKKYIISNGAVLLVKK